MWFWAMFYQAGGRTCPECCGRWGADRGLEPRFPALPPVLSFYRPCTEPQGEGTARSSVRSPQLAASDPTRALTSPPPVLASPHTGAHR